jgi:hypothetical protein
MPTAWLGQPLGHLGGHRVVDAHERCGAGVLDRSPRAWPTWTPWSLVHEHEVGVCRPARSPRARSGLAQAKKGSMNTAGVLSRTSSPEVWNVSEPWRGCRPWASCRLSASSGGRGSWGRIQGDRRRGPTTKSTRVPTESGRWEKPGRPQNECTDPARVGHVPPGRMAESGLGGARLSLRRSG